MNLGYDFIIIAIFLMASLLPFYIYRKKVFKFYYTSHDIDIFKKNLILYLEKTYPKIHFNFSIYNKINHEKDSRMKQVLMAEDIAQQFALYDFKLLTQKQVSKSSLWSNYESNSKPIKNHLPKDLQKILTVAMKNASYDMYIQSYHESGKNLATLKKDYPNIKMRSFPKSVMTAMKETNDALLKEFAAKDPMTAEILKSIQDYQTKVRAWTNLSDRAYLDTTDPK